jgi:hypothetical protein
MTATAEDVVGSSAYRGFQALTTCSGSMVGPTSWQVYPTSGKPLKMSARTPFIGVRSQEISSLFDVMSYHEKCAACRYYFLGILTDKVSSAQLVAEWRQANGSDMLSASYRPGGILK